MKHRWPGLLLALLLGVVAVSPARAGVRKETPLRTVGPGSLVEYTIEIENETGLDLVNGVVEDAIPTGFHYLQGSASLDGGVLPEPVSETTLFFILGDLPAGSRRVLVYTLIVGSNAAPGTAINLASARGLSGGSLVQIGRDEAEVTVDGGPLVSWIRGGIYRAPGGGGPPGPEDGIPGVTVVLEDGRRARSDARGEVVFYPVPAGDHLLRLDRESLSPALRPLAGIARFVRATPGGEARVSFLMLEDRAQGTARLALRAEPERVRMARPHPARYLLVLDADRFEAETSSIRQSAHTVLSQVAERARNVPIRQITLTGFSSATNPQSEALAEARAGAVRSTLAEAYGLELPRMTAGTARPRNGRGPGSVEILLERSAPAGLELAMEPPEVTLHLYLGVAGSSPLSAARLEAELPRELVLIRGSSTRNGHPTADPSVTVEDGEQTLLWDLGDLPEAASLRIGYRVALRAGTGEPPARLSSARLVWTGSEGQVRHSPRVTAQIDGPDLRPEPPPLPFEVEIRLRP